MASSAETERFAGPVSDTKELELHSSLVSLKAVYYLRHASWPGTA